LSNFIIQKAFQRLIMKQLEEAYSLIKRLSISTELKVNNTSKIQDNFYL